MKLLITLCAILLSVNAMDIKSVFEGWKVKYSKNYETDLENRYRLSVFSENLANIQERNAQGRTVKIGLNMFADLTIDEFITRNTNNYVIENNSAEKI